ncbi:MAG: hypothetical protein H7Y30_07505 [Pyrinomonadaceae bacterium]|nr:hypothetical protein [Pyrinomonadaceae bacterium]
MRKIIPFIIKLSAMLMVISVISSQVSATKGDVERALELLKQARAAIGGESAINSVQNLSINGKARRQIKIAEQGEKQLNGEFEMNLMLPDRLIKMEKLMLGTPGEAGRTQASEDKIKIRDARVKIVRAGDAPAQIQAHMQQHERSEIARYMLGLLLTPPPSFNATYNYLGEGNVEGARADIIEAQGAGNFVLKIYLDKSTHLPLMMSYQGTMPRIMINKHIGADGVPGVIEEDEDVIVIRRHKDEEEGASADKQPFTELLPAPEKAEIQVRFSDFRSVGGVLLPHTLTQIVNGTVDTVWTVDRYEINSPNINEKFNNEKFKQDVMIRSKQN